QVVAKVVVHLLYVFAAVLNPHGGAIGAQAAYVFDIAGGILGAVFAGPCGAGVHVSSDRHVVGNVFGDGAGKADVVVELGATGLLVVGEAASPDAYVQAALVSHIQAALNGWVAVVIGITARNVIGR